MNKQQGGSHTPGLSARIAEKRQREGLNLRDAGRAAGVSFSTLARIEAGKTPSYKVALQIEAWLRGEAPPIAPPPMELRDWFAGQAIEAAAVNAGRDQWGNLARRSYAIADAMLAERAKARPEASRPPYDEEN